MSDHAKSLNSAAQQFMCVKVANYSEFCQCHFYRGL